MSTLLKFSTLIELVRHRAENQSDRIAYTFIKDEKTESEKLTYQELDKKAQAIAALLQSLNAQGERALLLYPQNLEVITAFCGCLYAGTIAIPLPPPDSARLKRTLPRLLTVIKDAEAKFILTTFPIKSSLNQLVPEISELKNVRWLITDEISLELASNWKTPKINSDSVGYLQYTSGSTREPKGVMVSHKNLMHNLAGINQALRYTPDSIAATWLPYFHDYGLVDGILSSLYAGIPSFVMSPIAFIKQPFRWLQMISRYRVTHSGAPNFAYEYCVQRITPEQREALDLSCWRMAGIGAEPIRQETLERFAETFSHCGFRRNSLNPGYGLAEATLIVSCIKKETDEPIFRSFAATELAKNCIVEPVSLSQKKRTITGCGKPLKEIEVVIVNPEKCIQCEPDEVGEIWVSGDSVALGYWNNLAATQYSFQAYLADTGTGPFLRTGDLGFFKDGELFITGRLKDLIIIGGANHYPQDIEMTVEKSYISIRPTFSAAFSVEVKGEEKLIVVAEVERRYSKEKNRDNAENNLLKKAEVLHSERRQIEAENGITSEVDRPFNATEAFKAIRQAVSESHEIRVYAIALLKAGSIPKTSSGKIQRSACRKGFLEKTLEVVEQWCENPNWLER